MATFKVGDLYITKDSLAEGAILRRFGIITKAREGSDYVDGIEVTWGIRSQGVISFHLDRIFQPKDLLPLEPAPAAQALPEGVISELLDTAEEIVRPQLADRERAGISEAAAGECDA